MNKTAVDVLHGRPAAGVPVARALFALLAKDGFLLKVDANERSIAHRFAGYLQEQLPSLHVDCEYNRDGIDPKRIQKFHVSPNLQDTEAKTVFPDVVAHIRGTDNNFLVIEMKKSTNTVDRQFDIAKLRGYKKGLNYKYALFVEFYIGEEPDISDVMWIDI